MVISNISNQINIGEQSNFTTEASSYDKNFGFIQSFSYSENETIEQVGAVGGGMFFNRNEPGVYSVTGTLVTRVTKSTLPNVLKSFFGNYSDDGTDYTVIPDKTVMSYSVKAQHTLTEVAKITGLVFTNLTIDASKDGFMELSLDYFARKLDIVSETLTTTLPSDAMFSWLDIFGTYDSNAIKANNYSLSFDWNMDANDGRGLENVSAGERRLIQRAIKNNLTVSGSFEALIENSNELGYADEKTDKILVLTSSRGTDNAHTITLTGCQLDNKDSELNSDTGMKTISADILAREVTITGDL